MSEKKPAREPIAEDARIDALEARLSAAREREEERNRPTVQGTDANYRAGNRAPGNSRRSNSRRGSRTRAS